jgi:two-component system NtrC family sensor kinase
VLDQAGPINEQQADFVASAQREVTRLFDLTGDLLDLGRLESGIDLDMAPCDLGEMIEGAIASWQSQAQAMQHLLLADLPSESVRIFASPALLRRVIDNLLSNAIKYMSPGGQIDVQLSRVGHEAVLRIQDTGFGIAANDQPYVFDRFYRVRNEQTRDVEGTGLGLAIVRSIVERHDGRVWLESELGRGTTVGVVLPIMEDE